MSDFENDDLGRVPCKICERKFAPDVLERHAKICNKNAKKKPRKVFDSGKHRAEGTDIPVKATMRPGQAPKKDSQPQAAPKTNWRAQHEEFVNSIRQARGVTVAMKTGAPLPPPPAPSGPPPGYIQCPGCGRHFNQKAGERHIPGCKDRVKLLGKPVHPSRNYDPKLQSQKTAPAPRSRGGSQANSTPASSSSSNTRIPGPGSNHSKPSSRDMNHSKPSSRDMNHRGAPVGRGTSSYAAAKSGGASMYSSGSAANRQPSSEQMRAVGRKPPSPVVGRANSNSTSGGGTLAKFCFECGEKFPVATAKFCINCGVKRVTVS